MYWGCTPLCFFIRLDTLYIYIYPIFLVRESLNGCLWDLVWVCMLVAPLDLIGQALESDTLT
jgi:hypothetical protein